MIALAISLDERAAHYHYQLAEQSFWKFNPPAFEKALDIYKKATWCHIRYAPAYAGMVETAIFLLNYEYPEEFRKSLHQIIEKYHYRPLDINRNYWRAWRSLALYFYHKKNYKKAQKAALKCLELKEDPFNFSLCSLVFPDNPFREGTLTNRWIKRAIEMAPELFLPYYILGEGALKDGDMQAAIFYFEESVERNPKFFDGWIKLGKLYMQLGYHGKAAAAFEKASEIWEKNPKFIAWAAVENEKAGNWEKSLLLWKKCLRVSDKKNKKWRRIASERLSRMKFDIVLRETESLLPPR